MTRAPLPHRRRHETIDINHLGHAYAVSVGLYGTGVIGEVFVQARKPGSEVEALARDAAIAISLALQHGCPLDTMRHAMTREEDEGPSTLVGAVLDALHTNAWGRAA